MSLLHKTKNKESNNDRIFRLMTPMIAGIVACVFCLVSMTWAWFTASVDTGTQTMQSATRSTSVTVYEISQTAEEGGSSAKTPVMPEVSAAAAIAEDEQTDENASVVAAGESLVWNLSPEKSYEVVMTGSGTASTGYCKVALSHTASGSDIAETKLYTTSAFEKNHTVKFTYNTGGFSDVEGVTETQYREYVETTTPPTLTIASYWGKPSESAASAVSLMSLNDSAEEFMLLSDGDVLGLAPIACPEAKAESEIELEGFEAQEGAVISAEEDYKISLILKEGYEMPSEVVVNIDGKNYTVSTQGTAANEEAPYYDPQSGVLTVPSALLSDGATISVKATATQLPEEAPEEEIAEEEVTEETTEETTDSTEAEEDNAADATTDNTVVADNPKKEEDGEQSSDEPDKTPSGSSGGGNGGGNDGDTTDNNADNTSGDSATAPDNSEEETEVEKADVTLNLSQLTINLEETQIPTNADLVLTLSAKEDMELPEQIVITLDKTIREEITEDEENTEDEEIIEDKTEYIINTDGKDNPDGFEFDVESGELTISSALLEGVREITIADVEQSEATEPDEKAAITFEVKNLTFDFTDDEIATDEDVVITFTAGEGYELPETIVITIDGEEYTIYTADEESGKNPEGITFDAETGTLTISADLLKDAEAITITAEGIKKEDEESAEKEEASDADKKEESEDAENTENDTEGGEAADKETEGETKPEGGESTDTTTPETNPDNTTEGENTDETETPETDSESATPTEPETEDGSDSEQGTDVGENTDNGENTDGEENTDGGEENGDGTGEDETQETTKPEPDTESGDGGEATTPAVPTTPAEPSEPAVTPETPKTDETDTSEPATGETDSDNGAAGTDDSGSTESSNSGNDSTESDASSEGTPSATPSETQTAPTTSAPASSETSRPAASTQASSTTSGAPASAAAPSDSGTSNGAGQASAAAAASGSKETSSDE